MLLQPGPSLGHLYGLPGREVDSRVFVATAVWAVDKSIEVPFFRRLDEHFWRKSDSISINAVSFSAARTTKHR